MMNKKVNPLLAVYGTLMKGFGNHRLLEGRAELVSSCVQIKGSLYAIGGKGFPCFVSSPTKYPNETILAEVWKITDPDAWEALDYLEGYDANDAKTSMYIRRPIRISMDLEKKVFEGQPVMIYEWNGSIQHLTYIETGDWKTYVNQP